MTGRQESRYFKWKVLAFGYKAAVDNTKKILKPLVELVRRNGVFFICTLTMDYKRIRIERNGL